jgi:NitT/TauT family transport system substrate-binding protein
VKVIKSKAVVIGALLIIMILFSGCVEDASETKESEEVIKVSKYYWPGEYWQEVAVAKGFFEEEGLNVELIDTNQDYEQSLKDMINHEMDVNQFTMYAFMKAVAEGHDLVAVINTDKSNGVESILATQDIKNVQDLAGKKVGVQKDSYLNYILTSVLEDSGVSSESVERVEVPGEEAGQGLINGEYDAIVMWEPIISETKISINGNILFDTSQSETLQYPGVLVFHRTFVEERGEDLQKFVNVWARTTKYMQENQEEAFGVIAQNYGVTVEEVAALAEVDLILDLSDNNVVFSYGAGYKSLYRNAEEVNLFLIDSGISQEKVDATQVILPEFINAVEV